MWTSNGDLTNSDEYLGRKRKTLGTLFLMITTPAISMIMFHVNTYMDSDFMAFAALCVSDGLITTIYSVWPNPWDVVAWKMIVGFMVFELILQRIMPGKKFIAKMTAKGNTPVYKANGMACYLFTLATLIVCNYLGVFRAALVYDKFGEILSSMNVFTHILCILLLIKGKFSPSSSDSSSSRNVTVDYYWGTELYPRVLGWDVKLFTNSRVGIMYWAVGIVCYAAKNIELNGGHLQPAMYVNVALQLVYITKFFHDEMGYMCSSDIRHDYAGYYICWGVLVWVPSVYTSSSFYMTKNAPHISWATAILMFTLGTFMIWINFDSKNQIRVFKRTHGECLMWGSKPKKIIAEYTSETGEVKRSLLLLSGWCRISRHFHYVPEILASFLWSVPALFSRFLAPYFYVTFLTILLVDKAIRDDERCSAKYGAYWETYCRQVPYKLIPGLL